MIEMSSKKKMYGLWCGAGSCILIFSHQFRIVDDFVQLLAPALEYHEGWLVLI